MKKFIVFLKIMAVLVFAGVLAIIGLYTYAFLTPKIPIKSANQLYIYDKNNELIHQGSSTNKWVDIENISPYLIDAVVSSEDKNFYQHHGFDYLRIVKAMYLNVKNGKIVQGASTISQQYIKNMYLDFAKTWSRKIEEAFLTFELEVHYEKDDILEGYLNTINYGQGNYGIENASLYYFNKSSKDLTLQEAAMLAAIPKSPNNYNPISNKEKAIKRAKIVLNAMYENGKITEKEKDVLFEGIEIYGKKENNNLETLMYYQEAVVAELKSLKEIPNSLIESGGLKIYTNFDMNAQTALENSIKNNIKNSDIEVSSVIVNPSNGGIVALTGGKDYSTSQYNRALKSYRQVGSTIKPLLYYAALENGFTSSSTFLSAPTEFVFENNKTYAPTNFNDRYGHKEITMAAAIAYSDNIYAVKTHLFLGEEVLVDAAKKMGIKTKLSPIPSLALGSIEMNILEFAQAYQTLASGGFKNELFIINKVEDLHGKVLYEHKNEKELVLNTNYAYILNELLTNTYNSALKDYANPTVSSIASRMTRKYAIKSGSTNTDYWVVGYNPDYLMLVWNGKDDGSDMVTSDAIDTKLIWVETMENILKDTEEHWYDTPKNVVALPLNGITAESNNDNKILFYYVKGTEPTYGKNYNMVESKK